VPRLHDRERDGVDGCHVDRFLLLPGQAHSGGSMPGNSWFGSL
jgi:hypothetical protein